MEKKLNWTVWNKWRNKNDFLKQSTKLWKYNLMTTILYSIEHVFNRGKNWMQTMTTYYKWSEKMFISNK